MAAIDKDQLLIDEKLWLPPNNVLTDAQMTRVNEYVIANELPADDDEYYAQALCLGLEAIGIANLAKYTTVSAGRKREKSGGVEVEFYDGDGGKRAWEDFLDSLRDICPIFGYYDLPAKGGIKITTSETPNVNPICNCIFDDEF